MQPALVEPLRRWDPEQVGSYVIIGRLGAGAMGQVYLGRSAAGRLVAVKTIKTELAEEPDFRTRFGQEVAAARRVSGAFTAAVVAADSEADMPWLATVYVPAPSLSRLVRACGPLSVPAVRWLAARPAPRRWSPFTASAWSTVISSWPTCSSRRTGPASSTSASPARPSGSSSP